MEEEIWGSEGLTHIEEEEDDSGEGEKNIRDEITSVEEDEGESMQCAQKSTRGSGARKKKMIRDVRKRLLGQNSKNPELDPNPNVWRRTPGDPTAWRRNARDPTPGRRDARIQRHGAGTPGIQHHGAGTTWYNRIASRHHGSNGLDDAVRRHRMCTAGVERQSGRPDVKGPEDGAWEPGIETMAFQIVSLPIEAPAAPETQMTN
ncbi:hypothetical protein BGX38DRAFT_1275491 [Terfezia claveryi]|nr:hypothetical protein BGX38DRAFT_1275491 [Terfezia claveryi]